MSLLSFSGNLHTHINLVSLWSIHKRHEDLCTQKAIWIFFGALDIGCQNDPTMETMIAFTFTKIHGQGRQLKTIFTNVMNMIAFDTKDTMNL
jgi:hypothetical protein